MCGDREPAAEHRTVEVHRHHAFPRGEVHRHDVLVDAVLVERGRVVVQDVETAERGDGVGDHRRDRVGIGDVDDLRACDAARGFDLGDDLGGRGFGDVGDGHRARLRTRAAARSRARCPIRRR